MFLVLGGNGFIGYNFIKRFSEKERIRVFGRTKKYRFQNPNIEFIEGDFKFIDFDVLLEGIDTVFHFISSTVPFDGTSNIIEDIETNVLPTIRLLEAMKRKHIKKIYFISSGGTVYGECTTPALEDARLYPECAYAVQKICIEYYLHLYEKYDDMQGYILRVSNPYGLETNKKKKQGIIPIFTQKIINGEAIEVWGTGENKRDYIYIDEVIDAIESIYQYDGQYRIFNIGTGSSYSIHEIINLIESETHMKASIEYKEIRKCDVMDSFLDVSLIYNECGWKSKLTIEEGIKYYVKNILSDIEK